MKSESRLIQQARGKVLKRQFNLLIADRNPHVRDFLKREMAAAGYQVRLAENARQLIKWLFNNELIDLLILDPDLPDTDITSLFRKLRDRIPNLPIVIHTYISDYNDHPDVFQKTLFVEKEGNSIDHLKKVVFEILDKPKQGYGQSGGSEKHHSVKDGRIL